MSITSAVSEVKVANRSRRVEGRGSAEEQSRMFQSLRGLAAWTKIAAALAALLTFSARGNPQQIYRKILPSVMTLEVEAQSGRHFVGCAVMALADDTALTAWHVVND